MQNQTKPPCTFSLQEALESLASETAEPLEEKYTRIVDQLIVSHPCGFV